MNKPLKRAEQPLRDRVVDLRRIRAGELRANAKNWRLHPEGQKTALSGLLKEVGFVGALIARELPDGTLELIDGHLRADVAADSEVPVLIVDLNDEEAAKVLTTFDPLSAMAIMDDKALAALLGQVTFEDADLRKLLSDLQEQIADEEEQETEERPEVPGMALQPHEHYDYLVVLASTSHEWNSLCDMLDLKAEKRRKRIGTCRAIRASKLIELVRGKNA